MCSTVSISLVKAFHDKIKEYADSIKDGKIPEDGVNLITIEKEYVQKFTEDLIVFGGIPKSTAKRISKETANNIMATTIAEIS